MNRFIDGVEKEASQMRNIAALGICLVWGLLMGDPQLRVLMGGCVFLFFRVLVSGLEFVAQDFKNSNASNQQANSGQENEQAI